MDSIYKRIAGFISPGLILKTLVFFLSVALAIYIFPKVENGNLTFTNGLQEPANVVMAKFNHALDNLSIKTSKAISPIYEPQEIVGKITIPKMDIYDMPIYYGSDDINNNWGITTPGHIGNYGMFGETEPTAIGAHNYQLFKDLPKLEINDKIMVTTFFDTYIYEVKRTAIYNDGIHNWEDTVFNRSEPFSMILMTCYPIDKIVTNDMYIVETRMIKGTVFD